MKVISGIGITSGVAAAKAHLFLHRHKNVPHNHITSDDVSSEIERYKSATEHLVEHLSTIKNKQNEVGALAEVQKSMLKDPELEKSVIELIENKHYTAAWAVESAIDSYIALLSDADSTYFQERALDFKDIKDRLSSFLLGLEEKLTLTSPSIIVADYLMPSEVLNVPVENIKGIALKYSGKTSHVAILAHAASIPAVFSLSSIDDIKDGDFVVLDGEKGELIIEPSDKIVIEAKARIETQSEENEALHGLKRLPSITKDGREIKLYANVGDVNGVDSALEEGADGIGLFRSEILLMNNVYTSDYKKRAAVYKDSAERFSEIGPVTIRTFDVGGDKTIDGVGADEENPFLGLRSIRYCLAHKEFFRNQIKAILTSSVTKNVRIMFPMITGSEELDEALAFLESVKKELDRDGIEYDKNIKVGSMIEVPSAALTSYSIAKKVDFMSIGTNDLIQYTIAVDRGNEKVSYLYEPLHPAHLALLRLVLENGKKAGVEVSICGEMAGDVSYIPLLVGLGFEKLSMAPSSILRAKAAIRALEYEKAKALADEALRLDTISSIKELLKDFNNGKA